MPGIGDKSNWSHLIAAAHACLSWVVRMAIYSMISSICSHHKQPVRLHFVEYKQLHIPDYYVWTKMEYMPTKLSGHATITLASDVALVCGGEVDGIAQKT